MHFQSNIENTGAGVFTSLTVTLGDNAKNVESITLNLEKAGSLPGLLKGTQIVACESDEPPGKHGFLWKPCSDADQFFVV